MKNSQIAGGAALSLIIILLSCFFFLENPEKAKYNKTLKTLMQNERIDSIEEKEKSFPILEVVRVKIDSITILNNLLSTVRRSPSPTVSNIESIQLIEYTRATQRLKKHVNKTLHNLSQDFVN